MNERYYNEKRELVKFCGLLESSIQRTKYYYGIIHKIISLRRGIVFFMTDSNVHNILSVILPPPPYVISARNVLLK